MSRFSAFIVVLSLAFGGLADRATAQVGDFLSTSKGKADAFGGAVDDGGGRDGLSSFSGSFTIPLIGNFNLQIDGLIGGSNNTNWAVTGHVFWHDPKIGLADINLSQIDFSSRSVTRIGLHGQYYLGPVTIKGNIGFQFIDRGGRDSVFGDLVADYFPIPNLKLQIGGIGYRKQGIGFGEVEYLLPLNKLIGVPDSAAPPLTVWINGGAGNNRYWHVMAGIRIVLGCNGTLLSLSRNCGTTNHLKRWVSTLRPAIRRTSTTGDGTGRTGGVVGVPSDIRLKTDVIRLATLPSGIGIYHFRYVLGGKAWIGVMAQEVAQLRPDALVAGPGGVLMVNYRRLGFEPIPLDD